MNEADAQRVCAKCGCHNDKHAHACWNCRTALPRAHDTHALAAGAGLPELLQRFAGQTVQVNATDPQQHEAAELIGVHVDHFSVKPLDGDTVHHLPYQWLLAAREVMAQPGEPDSGQPAAPQLHLDITRQQADGASRPD
jgi:hypothetical protein